ARADKRTVWEGTYTSTQAARGQKVYDQRCSSCHGLDLNGGETAPALKGASFITRYRNRPLSELFQKIEETMPQDAPGTLDPKACADLISFVLKKQEVPAGETELPPEVDQLAKILIAEK